MAAIVVCPSSFWCPSLSLESLWNVASPRDPVAFWELERTTQLMAAQAADQILGHHLTQVHQDADWVRQTVQKVRDNSPISLVNKGLREVSVLLSGGTRILLRTPYLRPDRRGKRGRKRTQRGATGVGYYPVLEALGIRDGVSPATRSQIALYTVQAGSYQEAIELLADRGLAVDSTTLTRIAQTTAQADISLREAALAQARALPLPEKGPLWGKRVRISLDGGRVRTRSVRPGRKTRKGRPRLDTPWREPRVLVIDLLDEDGAADPLRLPLYDVLLDDADATFALLLGYLRLLGVAQAQVVEFIADGADWIWDRVESLRQQAEIPVDKWVEVIDFYHASEHLHAAVELCRNLSAQERQSLYAQLRHTLRTAPQGVETVIQRLQQEAVTRRGKKMKKALAYFEKHTARMAYPDLDARHLPVGSGGVESAVRRVINARFKAPGTFWNEEQVEGLMHLRASFKAGRWDEMMYRVLTQTFVPPSFEPLTQQQKTAFLLDLEEAVAPEENLRKAA
jgi:hypothetical protein